MVEGVGQGESKPLGQDPVQAANEIVGAKQRADVVASAEKIADPFAQNESAGEAQQVFSAMADGPKPEMPVSPDAVPAQTPQEAVTAAEQIAQQAQAAQVVRQAEKIAGAVPTSEATQAVPASQPATPRTPYEQSIADADRMAGQFRTQMKGEAPAVQPVETEHQGMSEEAVQAAEQIARQAQVVNQAEQIAASATAPAAPEAPTPAPLAPTESVASTPAPSTVEATPAALTEPVQATEEPLPWWKKLLGIKLKSEPESPEQQV